MGNGDNFSEKTAFFSVAVRKENHVHMYMAQGQLSYLTQSEQKLIWKFGNLCLDPTENVC